MNYDGKDTFIGGITCFPILAIVKGLNVKLINIFDFYNKYNMELICILISLWQIHLSRTNFVMKNNYKSIEL